MANYKLAIVNPKLCSAVNAKVKMDDNTNANMIYSNLLIEIQYRK